MAEAAKRLLSAEEEFVRARERKEMEERVRRGLKGSGQTNVPAPEKMPEEMLRQFDKMLRQRGAK